MHGKCDSKWYSCEKVVRKISLKKSQHEGRVKLGPALCTNDGLVLGRGKLNVEVFEAISRVQVEHPDVVEAGVTAEAEHNIHMSFRR